VRFSDFTLKHLTLVHFEISSFT